MKRIRLISLLSIICLSLQAKQYYKIDFKQSDFFFEKKGDLLKIDVTARDAFFSDDIDAPALPCFSYGILRPNGNTSNEYHIEVEKQLIYEKVSLESNPIIFTKNVILTDVKSRAASKSVLSPVLFADTISHEGYNCMLFKITPFEYDYDTGRLFFISEIRIVFPELPQKEYSFYNPKIKWKIRDLVVNPEEIDSFYPVIGVNTQGIIDERSNSSHTINNGTIDYLIVTSEALKPAFQELASWKIRKGLRVKIISVEELYAECEYNGLTNLTNQEMIKNRLHSKYYHNNVKYVLLGGDESVVPVQYCQGKYISGGVVQTEFVPTDLYYTNCSAIAPTWDYNGNGIIGEMGDEIGFIPNFYLTRIPVETTADVEKFTQKLIRYEKGNSLFGMSYVNKMLLSGTNWDGGFYTLNNPYYQSNNMYSTSIQPNWSGNMNYLFQVNGTTYTNLSSNDTLTNNNLTQLINSGYHFIHMDSHGDTDNWILPGIETYSNIDASYSTNNNESIIVTSACRTNAFDLDNALSSAFLNANHGAIAYYGSSRDGLYYNSNNIGLSLNYNSDFFYYLFTGAPSDAPYRYGAVAAHSKQHWAYNAWSNETDGYRYLQFAINPLGDPEMPIYTAVPQDFSNVQISSNGNNVTVSTGGIAGCTIALTSTDDGVSYFEVAENVSSYVFPDVTCPYYVTITKHNYRPYTSSVLQSGFDIIGNNHIWISGVYSVNVPDGYTMSWQLLNYSSTPGVTLTSNTPNINQCTITCPQNYFNGTLKATIHYGSNYVATITKSISTAGDFHGTLSEPAHYSNDGNTYYPNVNLSFANGSHLIAYAFGTITLTSDDFIGANVQFQSTDSPVWSNNYGDGRISVVYDTEPCDVKIIGVNTVTQKAFRFNLHLIPVTEPILPHSYLNVLSLDGSLIVTLIQDDFDSVNESVEWTVNAIDALTGEIKMSQIIHDKSTRLNTSSLKSGLYIIQAIVGKEVLSKKVIVK